MSRYSTLLLLLKHMGFVNGRVQFQKLLFLLEKNYHIQTGYEFIPFKFGPYCQVVQEDIQHLIDYGYIEHEEIEKPGSELLHRYQITEYGEQYLSGYRYKKGKAWTYQWMLLPPWRLHMRRRSFGYPIKV